eukprot:UN34809
MLTTKRKNHARQVQRECQKPGQNYMGTPANFIAGKFECYSCNVWSDNFQAFLRHWQSDDHTNLIGSDRLEGAAYERNKNHQLDENAVKLDVEKTDEPDQLTEPGNLDKIRAMIKDSATEIFGYCELCDVKWCQAQHRSEHLTGKRHTKNLEIKKRFYNDFMAWRQVHRNPGLMNGMTPPRNNFNNYPMHPPPSMISGPFGRNRMNNN